MIPRTLRRQLGLALLVLMSATAAFHHRTVDRYRRRAEAANHRRVLELTLERRGRRLAEAPDERRGPAPRPGWLGPAAEPGRGRRGPPPRRGRPGFRGPGGPPGPPLDAVVLDQTGAILARRGRGPWPADLLGRVAPRLGAAGETWFPRGVHPPVGFARFETAAGTRLVGIRLPPPPRAPGWAGPLGPYLESSLLLFAAAALAGLIAVRLLTRRFEDLREGFRRLAAGEAGVRLEPGADDEIGELVAEFNGMAARLDDARRDLDRQAESRRQLLADVSHELATPLTGLGCQLELLAEGAGELAPADRDRIRAARRESAAASQRVKDLLLLARGELEDLPIAPEDAGIQRLLQGLADTLRDPLGARGVRVETDFTGEIVRAEVDPGRVEQAVRNLVQNAANAMPGGGRVTLRARPGVPDGAVIEVEDDGPGIPPGDREQIFERFRRGGGATGAGTGLGLAIAKRLVERHGGTLALADAPTGGARFRITLPARAAAGPTLPPRRARETG